MLCILLPLLLVYTVANECAMVDPNLQYWTNTATAARETSLLIAQGDFKLTRLEVTGQTTLQKTTVQDLTFDSLQQSNSGTAEGSSFQSQVQFVGGLHVEGPATFESTNVTTDYVVTFKNLDIKFGEESLSSLIDRIKALEDAAGIV